MSRHRRRRCYKRRRAQTKRAWRSRAFGWRLGAAMLSALRASAAMQLAIYAAYADVKVFRGPLRDGAWKQ